MHHPLRSSAIAMAIAAAWLSSHAFAQIILDGTFGTSGALTAVGGAYDIPSTVGGIFGDNLFHSFTEFNVLTGESATFSGPGAIANIIAGVSGVNPSTIDGLLASSIPDANLFFLNPNGVLMGAHASIDVDGAFTVSTADILHLADGGQFVVGDPAQSVLTTAAPSAFGFLAAPAPVVLNGAQLDGAPGETVSIVAGEVQGSGAAIDASGGRLNIVAAGSAGTAGIDASDPFSPVDLSSFTAFSDITLANTSLSVDGAGNGIVLIRGNDLFTSNTDISSDVSGATGGGLVDIRLAGDAAFLNSSSLSALTTSDGDGADIVVDAANVLFDQSFVDASASGAGAGGDVLIQGDVVELQNQSNLNADSLGAGAGGSIRVNANSFVMRSSSIDATAFGAGAGGGILIDAGQVDMDLSSLNADTQGDGAGGAIGVFADSMLMTGGFIDASALGSGPGGDIVLQAPTIWLEGAAVSAVSVGAGEGGAVALTANDLTLLGGVVEADTLGPSLGGDVLVDTQRLNILAGGGITASARGDGNAGSIQILANDILLDRRGSPFTTGIFGTAEDGSSGDAGDVFITSDSLTVANGAVISGSTFGAGEGGTVAIDATDVTIDGGDADFAGIGVLTTSSGAGGLLSLNADTLSVLHGGEITGDADGTGEGGGILLQTTSLLLDRDGSTGRTGIFVTTNSASTSAVGGAMLVDTQDLTVANGAVISASTFGAADAGLAKVVADTVTVDGGAAGFAAIGVVATGSGAGGLLDIESGRVDVVHGGELSAEATSSGAGGAILVNTGDLRVSDGGIVTAATSGSGEGGYIDITADTVSVDGGATGDASIGVVSEGSGNAGLLHITANQLAVVSGGVLEADARDTGEGGDMLIEVADIRLDRQQASGRTGIFATARGDGKGGRVVIDSTTLNVTNGAQVSASAFGAGDGGSLSIVSDTIAVDGDSAGIEVVSAGSGAGGSLQTLSNQLTVTNGGKLNAETRSDGAGGSIDINTHALDVTNGGAITAETKGAGAGGAVKILADRASIDGGAAEDATVSAVSHGAGQAGTLQLNITDSLALTNGGKLEADAFDQGPGGDINVTSLHMNIDGGGQQGTGVFANTHGSAPAGDITILSGDLTVADYGVITSSSFSAGEGGVVDINTHTLTVDGSDVGFAAIGVAAFDQGAAGELRIAADEATIRDGGLISAQTFGSGEGGGIALAAQNLLVDGASGDLTGILASTEAADSGGAGGAMVIAATNMHVTNGADISASTHGDGAGGGMLIQTDELVIDNGATLTADTTGSGAGGGVIVKAKQVRIDGGPSALATGIFVESTQTDNGGDSGIIGITADSLDLVDGGRVSASTQGSGAGGGVLIQTKQVRVDGGTSGAPTGLFAITTGETNGGDGGDIVLEGTGLALSNGGQINASTSGSGSGGAVVVKSTFVDLQSGGHVSASTSGSGAGGGIAVEASNVIIDGSGSGLFARSKKQQGGGAAGGISVTTDQLEIRNGGQVSGSTRGDGLGGDVTVTTDGLLLDGGSSGQTTGLFATAQGSGAGGDITVETTTATVTNHAAMSTSALGDGEGGSISIKADQVLMSWGGKIASASQGAGVAGFIEMDLRQFLQMESGAEISTSAAQSDGGDIRITTGDYVSITDSSITAQAEQDGGQITITTPNRLLVTLGQLTAKAGGNGGNIFIDPKYVILDRSRITADAVFGDGGYIRITAQTFLPSAESIISASSEFGVAGNIDIVSPDTNIGGTLVLLPSRLLSAEDRLMERCSVARPEESSTFYILGYGGAPPTPDSLLPSLLPH